VADNVVAGRSTTEASVVPDGTTFALDDVGGVLYQRVKLDIGGDGSSSPVTSTGLPVTDAGGSLTVDGTVAVTGVATAANQTTELAHLAAIETAVEGTLAVSGPLTDAQLRAVAVPVSGTVAVTGVATAANQSTANTALSAIQTAVEILDNTVSGSEMQVDVVAALPAGTNNIGDVDVLTVPADPFGVNADAASATGSISAKLRFIASTGIPVTGTVTVGSHAVTNAGTFAVQASGSAAATGGYSVATGTIGNTKTDIGVANTAGQVGGWYFYNPNVSVAYVQFFNAQASAVTLGTTAPAYSLGIPAGGAATVAAGMVGIQHATAISIAITTTRSGSTNTTSTVDYNIFYKQ
jgi:hypothetical protein